MELFEYSVGAIKHCDFLAGPADPLYKRFQAAFGRLVLGHWVTWTWPADQQSWKFQRGDAVLQLFGRWMRDNVFPREDYRELLELAVTYLGGQVCITLCSTLITLQI